MTHILYKSHIRGILLRVASGLFSWGMVAGSWHFQGASVHLLSIVDLCPLYTIFPSSASVACGVCRPRSEPPCVYNISYVSCWWPNVLVCSLLPAAGVCSATKGLGTHSGLPEWLPEWLEYSKHVFTATRVAQWFILTKKQGTQGLKRSCCLYTFPGGKCRSSGCH